MNLLNNVINSISKIGKWIAVVTIILMMLFITYAVLNREFFTPVVGDVELVQLGMLVLIMFGLGYSQSEDAHVSIGLIVDRLPANIQSILDMIAYLLTMIVSFIVSIIMFMAAYKEMFSISRSTDLLEIPHYPFKFIIALGFAIWGLEALKQILNKLMLLKQREPRGGS